MPDPVLSEDEDYSVWDPASLDEDASPEASGEALQLVVDRAGSGDRLDKWIATQVRQFSRTRLQKWIETGAIRVNGKDASIRQMIFAGDHIEVVAQRLAEETAFTPEPMDLAIVFEDGMLIVVNKPAGLVVHPAAGNWHGTLLNGLLHHAPETAALPRAGIVHRLDKETSGLMVVAKTLEAQTALVQQLQSRSVRREYLALVHGAPPDTGRVDAPIGRSLRDRKRMAAFPEPTPHTKLAVTHFRVLARAQAPRVPNAVALVCCRLETGRTHQIRVHMQWSGFPLVGDRQYGLAGSSDAFPRQALHAWQLGFVHPATHRPVLFQRPVPDDFKRLLEDIGISGPDSAPGSGTEVFHGI